MILNICENCEHGAVKNGLSHCGKAAIYSHLTNCIKEQALKEFVERNAVNVDDRQPNV